VLDDSTLALPDRAGNRRLDSLRNILENPNVGLIFFVPGEGETLRVGGKAIIVRDRT
jgi:predicted pyridoxine 5'-phosphate oxidase superfamily flavin-nucleotide-binding protein